jgi:GTPase SAR1 family protein
MAERIGAWKYVECSAKSREGVEDVFQIAARAALTRPIKGKARRRCSIQ